MIQKLLATCLRPVLEAEARLRQRKVAILVMTVGALGYLAIALLSRSIDWWSWQLVFGWSAALLVMAIIGLVRAGREPDLREMARRVEENHPDLKAALLAAMDQKPGPDGNLSYLQSRLLSEVTEHAIRNRWVRQVSRKRLVAAGWGQFASLLALGGAVWLLLGAAPGPVGAFVGGDGVDPEKATAEDSQLPEISLTVTPGDVTLEKGSRLVVEATFEGRHPAAAMLVLEEPEGERKIPMTRGLDDAVFSALLPKVDVPGTYHVAYEEAASQDYQIDLFEFPSISRVDALVTPPAFLEEEPREINDTRKISVMEGSQVDWSIRVNQPMELGELYGEDEVSIELRPDPDDPTLLHASHLPPESQRYRVHLVDADGRANKRPPWLTVNVKRNEVPELKLVFPGRDFDVSAVQELPVEAEVWDDIQVEAAGFAYQFKDEEKSVTLTTEPLAGGETHPLATLLDIEKLEAKPKDLITYYFWAEDRDNEGNLRRTTSDLFFAEVRFFEEIFTEGMPQEGGGGEGGSADELLQLQKDIINAAWRLRRYHDLGRPLETFADDVGVIQESQVEVMARTDGVIAEAADPELKQIYGEARDLMEQAADEFALVLSEANGDLIETAHQTARAVFAKLLEARSREQQIAMSKSQTSSGSQQQQQQRMNLELEQRDLKYEEQSKATPEQTAEQQENLAVLSRLKELARRQEAIAEKIKELENQLQSAGEEERAEIERQLKRLQEDQRDLLNEVDDLSERMDSEQNRPNMSEERQRLDETRENVQNASEQLESGDLADAANSATRAQRELKEMEETFRERTSRRFSEEMRGLRDSARQLAEAQEGLGESLEELSRTRPDDALTTEGQMERGKLAQEIAGQANELNELIEEMKTLSDQAEVSEPVLADTLYEAVRKAAVNGVQDALDEARDYTFYNRPAQALGAQQAAARGIEELRESIEAAAEKILGNEADALRMARSEIDQLIEESLEEARRVGGGESAEKDGDGPAGVTASREPREAGESDEGAERGEPGRSDEPGAPESLAAGGEGREPGESGPAGERGEAGEPGMAAGRGEEEAREPGEPGGGTTPAEPGETGDPGSGEGDQRGGGARMAEAGQTGEGGKGREPGAAPAESGESGQSGEGAPMAGAGQAGEPGEERDGSARGGLADGPPSTSSPSASSGTGGGLFFDQPTEQVPDHSLAGEGYRDFRDRLAQLEEMLTQEELRNSVTRVADSARGMRMDYANHPPQAEVINQRITEPLVELRQQVSEEIAKLNRENPIAPIDRDPVPAEFRDLVRRYYEELGSGN